jgi:hypothetical protein
LKTRFIFVKIRLDIVKFKKLMKIIILVLLFFVLQLKPSIADTLMDRWQEYSNWNNKPSLLGRESDLIYPAWFEGKWDVTNILVEQIAPLAPDFVTPGFESNRKYLDKSINFQVQFIPKLIVANNAIVAQQAIVGDRTFNSLKIGQAYLGDRITNVKVDSDNPNRQITYLSGGQELISTVIARDNFLEENNHFLASEMTQQLFRSPSQIYLNQVETTTNYHLLNEEEIVADQVTAIYLSPQDPNYFNTFNQPVALYRYQLKLVRN